MDTLIRYVGETKPFTTTLTEPVENPVSGVITATPIALTGLVSQVRFMAQDATTGETVIDEAATITEVPGNDATIGTVQYAPSGPQVANPAEWIQWWRLVMAADGSTQDTPETLIRVREHGVAAAATLSPSGVCLPWATNEDVFAYAESDDGVDYEPWLIEASEILYALSGRQFSGGCTRTVRPERTQTCGCFQVLSRGHLVYPLDWEWIGGRWCADGGVYAGCATLYSIELPGYVQSVTSVKISGQVVDPTTYRVDRNAYLVRLTDPTTGQNPGWPGCQDLGLPDDAPGTFSITYVWGAPLPRSAVRAAALLAYQLWLADNPSRSGECMLPAGWTSVSRQGVTISRSAPQRFPTEGTGIIGIDSFLNTYNPYGAVAPAAVYSPDVAPLPYRVS